MPSSTSPSPVVPAVTSQSNDHSKPRRFLPQPIETTTKSSKAPRQSSPTKEEAPKPRRFAPQPVEHSTRSSRNNTGTDDNTSKPRRFAPQIVEESRSSSRDKNGKPGRIRFNPQPIGTTRSSNRKTQSIDDEPVSPGSKNPSAAPKAPRKWVPDLIDTASRSRRVGNPGHHRPHEHRTEHGHHIHAREHRRHITGTKTPLEVDDAELARPDESDTGRRSLLDLDRSSDARRPISPYDGSPNPQLAALTQARTHSFRLPDLDTIESSESEPENAPSSRSSSSERGSPITASDSSFNDFYKHATRTRESIDETFTHYLLQLEAKKQRQKLQEQALAAFPNSDYHEPVQHYVNEEEDSDGMEIDERPVTWSGFDEEEILQIVRRRESTSTAWEQIEMQRHAERQEQERKSMKTTSKQTSQSPWWTPIAGFSMHQQESEIKSMRDRARPPMLGRDLVFPRCPSPQRARFDTTQRSGTISSIGSMDESKQSIDGGLWKSAKPADSGPKPSTSSANSTKSTAQGLWGGCCIGASPANSTTLSPPAGPTGLMTPQVEHASNPFEQSFANNGGNSPRPTGPISHAIRTPPTPPTDINSAKIDAVLAGSLNSDALTATITVTDAELERDYPDSFVTQVFNYLSLGYPTLARPFDAELSKISRIPVSTLRRDDAKARSSPRGYIRLGPDFEGGGGEDAIADLESTECVRWLALKMYVREWARQERNMVAPADAGGNWGTGARRGSWAW